MLEPAKPREDFLLKLDILQDEVQRQVDNFLSVERQARAKFCTVDSVELSQRRDCKATLVAEAMLHLYLAMGKVREEYAMHGSFTPEVGAKKD